eukprot:710276-Alexandrium_andersonii.AAC.1
MPETTNVLALPWRRESGLRTPHRPFRWGHRTGYSAGDTAPATLLERRWKLVNRLSCAATAQREQLWK